MPQQVHVNLGFQSVPAAPHPGTGQKDGRQIRASLMRSALTRVRRWGACVSPGSWYRIQIPSSTKPPARLWGERNTPQRSIWRTGPASWRVSARRQILFFGCNRAWSASGAIPRANWHNCHCPLSFLWRAPLQSGLDTRFSTSYS